MSAFHSGPYDELCQLCERSGLVVEVHLRASDNLMAIFVLPQRDKKGVAVGGTTVDVRTAVVATPFFIGGTGKRAESFDSASPQLLQMLSDRGYK